MKHRGTIALETPRLMLRRFEVSDAEAMYANYGSDAKVTRFLTWAPHESVDVSRSLLEEWVAGYDSPSQYNWAIVPKEFGQPIGGISVVAMDEAVGMMEIGYCIGSRWWGRGYTAEALAAVMSYLLGEVGVLRIQAKHDVNNPASGAVMRKCGLRYEGTLRGYAHNNQGIVDVCMYGLLSSDR